LGRFNFSRKQIQREPHASAYKDARRKNLTVIAFQTWLAFWEQTVLKNFKGTNAAISKAKQIGMLMQLKIEKSSS
jgi:hypothetical protein